jgi:integrase
MAKRQRNDGLRKICTCGRQRWNKCQHPWHFNFTWKGTVHRFCLDRHIGERIVGRKSAEGEAEKLRIAIRAGTFTAQQPPPPTASESLTVRALGALFLTGYSQKAAGRGVARRKGKLGAKASWRNDRAMLKTFYAFTVPDTQRHIGDLTATAVVEGDVEAFLGSLRAVGRAASTRNQYLQLVKSLSAWGVRKGYLERPWIDPLRTELGREKMARRHRRLAAGEEAKLLAAATPRLHRLIVAALETGCRSGELLGLQWRDVNLARHEIRLPASKTKDQDFRVIPVSSRLAAVLEMAKTDPAGKEFGPAAFVFGDEIGQRVKSVKKAWRTAVLKAHGVKAKWSASNQLDSESVVKYAAIDLHLHDLRHEAGSRWLEAGVPIHHVQELLGHADVKTTGIYLNATATGLHESIRRFDEARQTCKEDATETTTEHPSACIEAEGTQPKPLVN